MSCGARMSLRAECWQLKDGLSAESRPPECLQWRGMILPDPTCHLETAGHTARVGVGSCIHPSQAGFGFHSLVCDHLSGTELFLSTHQ